MQTRSFTAPTLYEIFAVCRYSNRQFKIRNGDDDEMNLFKKKIELLTTMSFEYETKRSEKIEKLMKNIERESWKSMRKSAIFVIDSIDLGSMKNRPEKSSDKHCVIVFPYWDFVINKDFIFML